LPHWRSSTSGQTLAEAFGHACEALDLHLESMAKLKMRLPRPKESPDDAGIMRAVNKNCRPAFA
jgi:predicted RNase H-like HicB family nuclease